MEEDIIILGFKEKGSKMIEKKSMRKQYRFDNFVVGSYNKLAYGAALKVAEGNADKRFNPLFNPLVFQIKWGACGLVLAGNAVIFLTIQGFFLVFGRGDDFSWEQW